MKIFDNIDLTPYHFGKPLGKSTTGTHSLSENTDENKKWSDFMSFNKVSKHGESLDSIIESLRKVGIEVEYSQSPVQYGYIKIEDGDGNEFLVSPQEIIDFEKGDMCFKIGSKTEVCPICNKFHTIDERESFKNTCQRSRC